MKNKRLALFDLDKTIYDRHSFFELAYSAVEKGIVSKKTWKDIKEITKLYKDGKQTYSETANQLLTVYSQSLKDIEEKTLYSDTKKYFLSNKQNFYSYFEEILPILIEEYDVYIITTNAQYVAQAICDIFNLQGFIASEFQTKKGRFVGTVKKTLADGKGMVSELITKYGKRGSIAVGDSENDISMLELVENPICINPSDELKATAEKKAWNIVTDKTIANKILKIVGKN